MAVVQRLDAAMGLFINKTLREFHTNVRGTVVDVDYSVPSVTVQPNASTEFSDGTIDAYPAVFDVPLQMPSGNAGKARLTMPIKAGDQVGLSFSERNEGSKTDMSTHGLFAGWAVSQIFSDGNAIAIDPDNVELWNDKVHFSLTPEGDYTLTGPVGTLKVDKAGVWTFDNGAAKFTAQTDGNFDMNGAKVTPDGNVITKSGTNLDEFYAWFKRHGHNYTWTDPAGTGTTQAPNT
ncbi:hypothetical protein pEaSNUABM56_00105 [Erwinia phage pEa_SNUABM_56]|uniref:Putative baseplate assembly protein n=1 Tax=Erwinia phage pEp_SNUABM_01 TaxID=2601643 RepID=A0A5J6DAK8_9CAUD|nr:baseplate spike [Erwinia phage pEp_SNUABM_01]QEQ94904.1 putative baseplate assembly protein [Erwinia phage pEp_SNUABM_01]UYL84834.1 hypothetical protein pEaSNUABM55_00036 [Erwinia phage pEa_SNUABM_55]UYL85150.1 hypothetical protein pEaSNUABM56_00105 [Erwinia phage pEa_SNUABM_56]